MLVAEEEISFNRDIRPILSDRCFKCHGPDAENQKSDFRLDTEKHAHADLGGYFGIVPGNLEKSEVHHLIHTDDEDEVMPPKDSNLSLSAHEKKLLDSWIKQGAKFEKHWSLKPLPQNVPVPEKISDWSRNEIDRFVEAGFVKHDVKAADEISPEKWLRRVSFDLTGLPPTTEEISAYLADTSPEASEKVVNRLLDSTQYAERMTSEWLDVARYSDSYGYQRDRERFVWPWRDWVIKAFRENMPYDQFATLQIAGDLLPDATTETILPTAFNRLHGHEMEGGIVLEEYRMEYIADRAQTFSSAFLGLTMECCRCHDHKYDPLPTRDYYSLGAFFANIEESGLISYFTDATPTPAMPISTPEADAEMTAAEPQIAAGEAKLTALRNAPETRMVFENWLGKRPSLDWPGLVADLSFDVIEDGKLLNSVAPNSPATTPPANTLVPGKNGQAIHFTGDDPLILPKVGHFSREHPYSASFWARPHAITARENFFSRSHGGDDAASIGYEFLLLDGKPTASVIHFWPGNAIRVQAKQALKPGEWQHLAMSYDGSSKAAGLSIYLNGEPLELEIIVDHLTGQTTEWTMDMKDIVLGERYRDRGFINGEMDDFRFFDRRIVDAEARQLFDQTYLADLLAKNAAELSESDRGELYDYFLATAYDPYRLAAGELAAARKRWNDAMDPLPSITIMRELPEPKPSFVLTRGAYDSHGEPVTADTPTALPPFPTDQPNNRLGLARWLTQPDHPLTARVTVNRYWQMIFGNGIVSTPEDFGSQGSLPTHPELLDWLARDFVEHDWDLHHLLGQMVLSSTYRQSTVTDAATREMDPENAFLCRGNNRRLTGEMIRDNALAVSGLLVDKIGGPPVKPYELAVSFEPQVPDKGDGLYRRSLYTLWKRNAPAPMLVTFDAPKRDVCSLRRATTTSPLQSLVTLNGPQFIEASRVLAAKLMRTHGGDHEALIKEAFLILTSREIQAEEATILNGLHATQLADFSANPEQAASLLETGEAPVPSDLPLAELATNTVLINTMMNFDESLNQR
ncbi:MAG: DUF1553 domain-containing protein [Akkermansiaceae bacterium]|jgi:hypothetical protein|nr:DUF1553 domain-containing protein [Akkermansiaceae bacterium]MDP4721376.1 DUF1553 domain-containing protein [Akkermansiaceae bacterium]MDP4779403.1 DUF1553 domain-containing protein [Akkermansiaceae bacterium]MDP4846743.1 DUF1553 domain-containing protein [Akkermansiaceae bacterium]MDP4897080.1 DUF1553 domain-containing protein [Akkermansiaceae bacterium]